MGKKVNQNNDEIIKLLKVVVGVTLIFIVFVIITVIVSNKKENRINYNVPEATIGFKEILVGDLLNQNKDEYYVLIIREEDSYYGLYSQYFSKITAENSDVKYYTVNLDRIFNKKYISDNSNLTVREIEDIRFNKETLVKVSKKQIANTYEGREAIVEHLSSLVK